MTTGRSFRQRPLDAHKELPIVRDESLLDSTEGLPTKERVEHEQKIHVKVLKSRNNVNFRMSVVAAMQRAPYHQPNSQGADGEKGQQ